MDPVNVSTQVQQPFVPITRLNSHPKAFSNAAMQSSSSSTRRRATATTAAAQSAITTPGPSSSPENSIPLFYRFSLLYAEPLFALCGALILHLQPLKFLATMTPSASTSITNALSSIRVLTDQLAAMQVLIACNTGILLRYAAAEKDQRRGRRLWRVCCAGMVVCDVLHVAASVRELGWEFVLSPLKMWRIEDWTNFAILGWMGAVRLAVVLGIGMDDGAPLSTVAELSADTTKRW